MTIGPNSLTSSHGLRALQHRNYRLFFSGQAISLIGTWMQQVAQAWLILTLTNDPLWLGLVSVAQFGPVIIFGLFGGLVADQWPKRQTLLVTQTVSMLLAFALFGLTVTGAVQVWQVMVLAALLGTTNAIDMPTRQAFAVEMVGREDMTSAVGLNAAVFNGSRIVGPALAGLIIGAFDISIAFLINGLSYVAVIVAYMAMRPAELRPVPTMARPTSVRGVFDSLAEGWHYVRSTPLVLLSVTVVGLVATFGMNFQVLIPPLAENVLNVGAAGYGFLMAASGVGSTAAALYIASRRTIGPRPIVIGAIALGLSSIVVALSTLYPLSLVAMVVVGAGAIGMAVTANTTIQLAVPDQLRGRVISLYTTVFAGSVPAGGLLMGWLASTWGVSLALLVGALASLAVGLLAWPWLARIQRAQRAERRNRPEVVAGAAGAAADPRLAVVRRR